MGGGIFTMHYIGMSALDASAYMIHDPHLRRRQHGDRHRRVRPGAVARDRAGRAAAADPFGGRLRRRGFRHALHGDGRRDAVAFRHRVVGRAGAVDRSPGHRRRHRGVLHFRNISVAAGARFSARGIRRCDRRRRRCVGCSRAKWRRHRRPIPPATARAPNPEFGRGTYAPLGGAGAPPRRFARHLPIERDGGTHFVAVEHVVAVHANAHYTYIFDGNDKLFCPLAIGDVESRLDKQRFVRVHRSHIVNIDRVVGYKRSGDNELVEMAAAHHYVVPVSRSRIGSLKSRVASLTGDESGVRAAPAPSFRSAINARIVAPLRQQH